MKNLVTCDKCKQDRIRTYRCDKRTGCYLPDEIWNDSDHIRSGVRKNAVWVCADCMVKLADAKKAGVASK